MNNMLLPIGATSILSEAVRNSLNCCWLGVILPRTCRGAFWGGKLLAYDGWLTSHRQRLIVTGQKFKKVYSRLLSSHLAVLQFVIPLR
jgi:hypothetical protein